MTAFYTDRVSARPGDQVDIQASSNAGPCRLTVSRVGRDRTRVLSLDAFAVGNHPTPSDVSTSGCGWPVAGSFTVGDWPTGYYDLELTDAAGLTWHHFLCVRPALGARRARALLVLSTNTYNAYNYWGGANAYCDVDALMSGRKAYVQAMADAVGVLSTRRPFPQMIIASPPDMPRLVNMRQRGFREQPWATDPEWLVRNGMTPFDGSAGFVNKWEHAFVRWAEEEGIALDYATDHDLDQEADALDGYAAVLLVGHSEYWTARQRDHIEAFVDGGGRLAIFSGNTAFWKVRLEDEGATFVCHKWRGFENDPAAAVDAAQATHLWSHPAFARPEASITGLTFLHGGYHRLGMCVSRGQGGYTIYDDRHWALDGTDLFYGDVMGGDVPLLGYENDGCRFTFGEDGLPCPLPSLGVPGNLKIIALAPCLFGEAPDNPYDPIVPPEDMSRIASEIYGDASRAADPALFRGHAVMASFTRGRGEVFNCGTTEWAHALSAGDPFVSQITRNVLNRFGATGTA